MSRRRNFAARPGQPAACRKIIPELQPLEARALLSAAPGAPAGAHLAARRAAVIRPLGRPRLNTSQPAAAVSNVPLTELTTAYQGLSPGLYDNGSNTAPAAQQALADVAGASIVPLDRQGRPAADGKIVMLTIGPSLTMLASNALLDSVAAADDLSPSLVVVNGGQNEMTAQRWAGSATPWSVAGSKLSARGVSPEQVQVIWLKAEMLRPWNYGDLSQRTATYSSLLTRILNTAVTRYPNLKIAYISSAAYAGYAIHHVVGEPTSYESAFGVRDVIERQIAGDPALNANPAAGPVRSPVLLWGPYLWANGTTPRADGLTWQRDDYFARDGVHPTLSGSYKIASQVMNFLRHEPSARAWFLAHSS